MHTPMLECHFSHNVFKCLMKVEEMACEAPSSISHQKNNKSCWHSVVLSYVGTQSVLV